MIILLKKEIPSSLKIVNLLDSNNFHHNKRNNLQTRTSNGTTLGSNNHLNNSNNSNNSSIKLHLFSHNLYNGNLTLLQTLNKNFMLIMIRQLTKTLKMNILTIRHLGNLNAFRSTRALLLTSNI